MPARTGTDVVVPVRETTALGRDVDAWFTGRTADAEWASGAVGHPSNLSHRRPHRPLDLARARAAVGRATGTDAQGWHLMEQVHGNRVAVVAADTPVGSELRRVDAVVTAVAGRVLGVTVADCVPVLLAGPTSVAAVHAGRAGVATGIVAAALAAMAELGDRASQVRAAIGPAIGGCCYEVPAAMRDELAAALPSTHATTTWGTPSLDLPAGVGSQLADAGVTQVVRVGGCTRCEPGWFSHRADPRAGRQLGLVVRHRAPARTDDTDRDASW